MSEPAFPRDHAHDGHNGMSLRDYFAAKADAGPDGIGVNLAKALMGSEPASASPEDPLANYRWWAEAEARWQYMHADAMLKARSPHSKENGNGD